MAQWLGQFTGNTHATKVQNLEASLRHAVNVFHKTRPGKARKVKAKAVQSLAKKLLSARLRLFKARIVANTPVAIEEGDSQMSGIESLRDREAKARAEGLHGILIEFSAQDAID